MRRVLPDLRTLPSIIFCTLSLEAISRYPVLGIGMRNFTSYSGHWREVHMSYLQIGAEAGIPGLVLYLLFFSCGFANLRRLKKMPHLDKDMKLFKGAIHSSLVGFIVGAFFSPEAYQYFPYFAVAYTTVLLSIAKEQQKSELPTKPSKLLEPMTDRYARGREPDPKYVLR
jgi:O-antigen ligase